MRQSNPVFPHISNEMIESGLRRARVERSLAMYSLIDGIFGRKRDTRPSSSS